MAIYTLLAPAYRLEGAYHTLPGAGDTFADERLRVTQTCAPAGEGLTLVRREWRNVSDSVLEIQPVTEAATHFAARDTLIPCVSYNGNRWGGGGEPKGLVRDNVPWVFAGTRSAIPACTLSEDGERVFALFASAKDEASLRASCSLVPQEDGAMRHRILYPVVEEPLSYIDRDTYGPALERLRTPPSGGMPTVEAYCYEVYAALAAFRRRRPAGRGCRPVPCGHTSGAYGRGTVDAGHRLCQAPCPAMGRPAIAGHRLQPRGSRRL
jgi:hypothetical protein